MTKSIIDYDLLLFHVFVSFIFLAKFDFLSIVDSVCILKTLFYNLKSELDSEKSRFSHINIS